VCTEKGGDVALDSRPELSPERTLDIVLRSIGELVDYELAVVLGYDGQDSLEVRTAMGPLSTPRLSSYSISLAARPDLALLLNADCPKLFAEDEEHLDTYAEVLDLPNGHSCLAAPLSVDGRPIGLLTLDHRSCGIFSKEIVRFIGAISKLVAAALMQAESARSLRDRAASLAAERNRLLALDSDAFRSLVGSSPAWTAVLDSIRLVAATDAPVLLLGETGTGKEEAARALHRLSARARSPFVALNCSALPVSLAESELFGHERGSFTGAQGLRRGRFELASGGTLFLDEIGELPLEIQPKLLRALQEGRFERVGGERPVDVDVRVVTATHVDLAKAVLDGRFREDLYYRLAVFPISLPPLRERGDDVLALAEHFASLLRSRAGWEDLGFDASALGALRSRSWPGNARELRNAVERAAIVARGGTIRAADLAAGEAAGGAPVPLAALEAGAASRVVGSLDDALRERIAAALAATAGRLYGEDGAAALLGLKPSTLQSKMKKLGIDRAAFAHGR
jgi:transcriptional regulator with GAF, ATPase, and Fis domain